jgi:hypothetical protein
MGELSYASVGWDCTLWKTWKSPVASSSMSFWALPRFLFQGARAGPLRLGLVSGRRRTGKTQLLTAVCEAVGGLYVACVQDEGDRAARTRFATAISRHAGFGSGHAAVGTRLP